MRVLGLDPGLTRAGYGIVERTDHGIRAVDHGVIRTPAAPVPERLVELYRAIDLVLKAYEPDVDAVERVLFSANVRTAMSVGQAAGIALLAAKFNGCEVYEYSPNEVKLSVTGYGGADKRQMQSMVQRLLQLAELPQPADAADALGLALTHLQAHRLKGLASRA